MHAAIAFAIGVGDLGQAAGVRARRVFRDFLRAGRTRHDRVSKEGLKKARVLVLFDTDGEPPASQDYKKQVESTDEAEFDVARAL